MIEILLFFAAIAQIVLAGAVLTYIASSPADAGRPRDRGWAFAGILWNALVSAATATYDNMDPAVARGLLITGHLALISSAAVLLAPFCRGGASRPFLGRNVTCALLLVIYEILSAFFGSRKFPAMVLVREILLLAALFLLSSSFFSRHVQIKMGLCLGGLVLVPFLIVASFVGSALHTRFSFLASASASPLVVSGAIQKLQNDLLLMGGASVLLAAAAGLLLGRRSTVPLERLAQAADRVGEGDLGQRVSLTGADEIGRLGARFDQMVARLEEDRRKILVAQEELKKAYEELQNLEKMKDTFLSRISHELRTPLTSIMGYAELIEEDSQEVKRYAAYAKDILSESESLNQMVENLLDVTRILRGDIQYNVRPFNAGQILKNAAAPFRQKIQEKQLTLREAIEGEVPCRVDPSWMERALAEFVSNAVKYTPEGGQIELGARLQDGRVALWVKDTGPGIPAEHQEKIFRGFHSVESIEHHQKGFGIGLLVARKVVEAQGGAIRLESAQGKGTTFVIEFAAGNVHDA